MSPNCLQRLHVSADDTSRQRVYVLLLCNFGKCVYLVFI